ncbi:MAG: hypothetical protein AAF569_02540 [Pseudomonadota bacterium]
MKFRFVLLSGAILSLTLITPAFAVDTVNADQLQVSRIGDTELECNALSSEASSMREIITKKEAVKQDARMQGHGVSAAAGIGGFLVGTVTGGIGFAAIGLLASEAIDADVEEAEDLKDIAAQRRSLMMGIFKAKGCYGPIEHVMLEEDAVQDTQTVLAEIKPASGRAHTFKHYNE